MPFTLALCEKMMQSRGIVMSREQILEGYMIFGGVPYYWSLLNKGASLTQEIDRLIFSKEGDMYDEFDMLYASLFKSPEPYVKIISLLAAKKKGMTRKELIQTGKFGNNGKFTELLDNLEWCGFIRSYSMPGRRVKDEIYQLMDPFTLFYYTFIYGKHQGKNYWQLSQGKPIYNSWKGLAFERVCLWHTEQIKRKLGISGILTNEYAWYCKANKKEGIRGTQIDLLIDRSDGTVNLCEMKYAKGEYAITAAYNRELANKRAVFSQVTKTRKAIHTTMITKNGLVHNTYWGDVQNEVVMNDLFI